MSLGSVFSCSVSVPCSSPGGVRVATAEVKNQEFSHSNKHLHKYLNPWLSKYRQKHVNIIVPVYLLPISVRFVSSFYFLPTDVFCAFVYICDSLLSAVPRVFSKLLKLCDDTVVILLVLISAEVVILWVSE